MLDSCPPSRAIAHREFVAAVALGSASLRTIAARSSAIHEWDMSWVDTLTAKYRAVFDCSDVNG